MKFEKNVGGIDRLARLISGSLLVIIGALITNGLAFYFFIAAGIVLLMTGIFQRCGLYYIIGKNTCEIKEKK